MTVGAEVLEMAPLQHADTYYDLSSVGTCHHVHQIGEVSSPFVASFRGGRAGRDCVAPGLPSLSRR